MYNSFYMQYQAKRSEILLKGCYTLKIGTQCVHVASQNHKTMNAILFTFFTIPTMQLLDLVYSNRQ